MTSDARIPMSPNELPRQRIHEVVGLPQRPDPFDGIVDYGMGGSSIVPKKLGRDAVYLCQVEWAWSPAHNRIDAYYLHRGRTHWSLWSKYFDDNDWPWRWVGNPVAAVPKKQADEKTAAVHLLIDFWNFDARNSSVDHYHWINQDAFLSVEEISAIGRVVWPSSDSG